MKKIIATYFLILLSSTSTVNSEPVSNFFEVDNPETSSLYIKTEKDIDDLDTVTYYISKEAIDRRIIDSFFVFSDKIEKNNGAIILSFSKEDDKYLAKKSKSKPPDTFSITSKSKCNFSYYDGSYIIFEDRIQSQCFYFKIDGDDGWLLESLNTIYQNTNNAQSTLNLEKIKEKELENLLFNGIELQSDKPIDDNMNEIHRFVGWLAEKMKALISSS